MSLDPTQGAEIQKTRPCVILTADPLNRLRQTVVAVPFSSSSDAHPPVTVPVTCQGAAAVAVIDQVRAISKHRLRRRIEKLEPETLRVVTTALARILEIP